MNEELMARLRPITAEEQQLLDGRGGIERKRYTTQTDFTVDSHKMLERGRLIDVRTHTRFVEFPMHKHNYIEILYMASGSTTHIIGEDETEVVLEKGDLLFLNQYAWHRILPAREEDIGINFIVLPEFFDVAFSMMEEENELRHFLIDTLRQDGGKSTFLHFRVSEVLPVQNLVENMVWSLLHRESNRRRISQVTMGLLFLQLLQYTDRLQQHSSGQQDNLTVLHALHYIEENYKTATLTELAESEQMSLTKLSRMIKAQTGQTFKELLQTKRFHKAVQLLEESSLPVSDIIAAVGYENTSFFFRSFRAKYGESPRVYRNHNTRK